LFTGAPRGPTFAASLLIVTAPRGQRADQDKVSARDALARDRSHNRSTIIRRSFDDRSIIERRSIHTIDDRSSLTFMNIR
jgi:hypothetical protein